MGYLALYRKYRPDTFEKLVGQDHIVKTLTNQIKSGRLGHAYLFTGTRGTGKTSAAKIFAKAINCLNPVNGSPCGKCSVCLALSSPSNIDVVEIDAASNNGVNEIRDLREKVQYPPVSCQYKVYIIDEVHMLTGPAFNALLKTLEEPPKHAVFVLATTEVHKIPATILSRCMRFDFRLIPVNVIANLISGIYDELGKKYEKEAVHQIALAGDGSVRDALSIADTALSFSDGELKYEHVLEIIGSTNFDVILSFIGDIISNNSGALLEKTEKLLSMGKSIGVLIKDVTETVRNMLVLKTCKNPNDILSLPENRFNQLKNLANQTSNENLIRIMQLFSQAENVIKYSTHPRIVFETTAINCAKPENDVSIDGLLTRVAELERKIENFTTHKTEQVVKPIENVLQNKDIENPKPTIDQLSDMEIKGKLLNHFRSINREMLWNVFQNVKISTKNGVLTVTTISIGDDKIVETNKDLIVEALYEYAPFTVIVEENVTNKKIEDIENETEKLKKLFGDDIVIIKD